MMMDKDEDEYAEALNCCPDTLENYAKHVCFSDPKVFFSIDASGTLLGIRPGLFLPSLIADDLLLHHALRGKVDDRFLNLIRSSSVAFRHVSLHGCNSISDLGLHSLPIDGLQSLNVSDCCSITFKSVEFFSQCKDTLTLLNAANCKDIIDIKLLKNFPFNKLSNLNFNSVQLINFDTDLVESFFRQLPSLTDLDISNQDPIDSRKSLGFLQPLVTQLRVLILYNCRPSLINREWSLICRMTKLRHLDISQEPPGKRVSQPRFYTNMINPPMLSKLIESAPFLASLDISRYNLGSWHAKPRPADGEVYMNSSVPGLECLKRPLEFLGIWMTRWNNNLVGLANQSIPANKIAGGVSKDALLTALEVYTERHRRFLKILCLFQKHPSLTDTSGKVMRVILSVLKAMSFHCDNSDLQIHCLEMLCQMISKYIHCTGQLAFPTGKIYRQIIFAILCTSERTHCGQSVNDYICEVLRLIKPWRNEYEYVSIFNMLLQLASQTFIDDVVLPLMLLHEIITESSVVQKILLVQNNAIESLLSMMHASTIPDEIGVPPVMGISNEMLRTSWEILYLLASVPGGVARFASAGGDVLFSEYFSQIPGCQAIETQQINVDFI
ncbi:protein zer-1 homolog [Saccoglossus kowalevskii]|uniref:Protein zer-1 homolog n=1 Tax=Saccoglossus kowalevskii TaxID=10224 RepID=A0ABM0MM65_SACKO|nr:PREDICTED: protein zer-1 homolog [Saccoglossus kowalevskii]